MGRLVANLKLLMSGQRAHSARRPVKLAMSSRRLPGQPLKRALTSARRATRGEAEKVGRRHQGAINLNSSRAQLAARDGRRWTSGGETGGRARKMIIDWPARSWSPPPPQPTQLL